MRDDEKECGNCLHSYMVCEQFHLRQKCRSPEYNSPDYTQEMLLEDWGRGYCRFWTPKTKKGNHYEK